MAVVLWVQVAILFAVVKTAEQAAELELPLLERRMIRRLRLQMHSGKFLVIRNTPNTRTGFANVRHLLLSALASLDNGDSLATSPPSNPSSPQLTKSRPAVEQPSSQGKDDSAGAS